MMPNNVALIFLGRKTTTTRSISQFKQIGLEAGETGRTTLVCDYIDRDFLITCRGLLTCDEAGGIKAMLASEGMFSLSDCKYTQTVRWFTDSQEYDKFSQPNRHRSKLYVYDIKPVTQGT